jgi:hypothetical protein
MRMLRVFPVEFRRETDREASRGQDTASRRRHMLAMMAILAVAPPNAAEELLAACAHLSAALNSEPLTDNDSAATVIGGLLSMLEKMASLLQRLRVATNDVAATDTQASESEMFGLIPLPA